MSGASPLCSSVLPGPTPQDRTSPFFTTSHFDGHPSVLLRASRIGELALQELTEVVQDAWLCQASSRRAAAWLSAQQPIS
jgi:hypothetical protein